MFRRLPDPEFAWARPVFEVFPELDEWRPRDIFKRCEDEGLENLWQFESRTDDLMILSNGAKVNPLHIELNVTDHPALKGCLMFGDGHTTCGMLLEPNRDDIEKDELVETLWPTRVKATCKSIESGLLKW